MAVRIALVGDTMLGRGVAERLAVVGPNELVAPEVAEILRAADLSVMNLECCISDRGEPWPDPHKPFFFRAPPLGVETLVHLGVDAVTLANNHALDFGTDALLDTLGLVHGAGIRTTGAGDDLDEARRPAVLASGGIRIAVLGVSDHPEDFAAGPRRAGIAHADLRRGTPAWLLDLVAAQDADVVLVTPHWGPNLTTAPPRHVQRAGADLLAAGATLVAGHSAHVFHGVALPDGPPRGLLYDLGDFIDDYVRHPDLRNDLGLVWEVTVEPGRVVGVEATPIKLAFARTELAVGADRAWVVDRLRAASAGFGTTVADTGTRLVLDRSPRGGTPET
jgi:poly-gamma-glutamate capsule biosynthesis protein CapA/YwtB (metallophosphatase superfamily)